MPETPAIGSPLGSLMGLFGFGAGTEGVAAGVPTSSLFGQLVQGSLTEGQAVSGAGNTPLLAQMIANFASFNSAAGTQPVLPLQLGDVNVAVQGTEVEAVQVLSQSITVLYQRVVTEGVSFAPTEGRTAELANALTMLGIPPEEAQAMAKQIETMLALLERELEKMKGEAPTPETSTSLAVMLMAGMLAQTQTAQTTTSVTIETVSIEVSITQSQSIVVRLPEATSSARDVVLGNAAPAAQKQSMVALQTPATPQVVLDVTSATEGAETTAAPTLQVAITPDATTPETPIAMNVPQPTVQKIETPKDIVGKTLYVLKEAPTGATTVQALTPVQETETTPQTPTPTRPTTPEALETLATESAPELATSSQTQTTAAQALAPTMQRFAEQLKHAQHHQVAQQVVVAVQPLLKGEGSSAVRMTMNPPELGRIEIHLKIEAGQVSGAIAATEPATVEHLARELPTLRQAFAEAGLKLGEQGLSLMLNQENNQHNAERQPNPFAEQQQNAPRSNAVGAQADEDSGLETILTSTGPSRWVSPDRMLDREV